MIPPHPAIDPVALDLVRAAMAQGVARLELRRLHDGTYAVWIARQLARPSLDPPPPRRPDS